MDFSLLQPSERLARHERSKLLLGVAGIHVLADGLDLPVGIVNTPMQWFS